MILRALNDRRPSARRGYPVARGRSQFCPPPSLRLSRQSLPRHSLSWQPFARARIMLHPRRTSTTIGNIYVDGRGLTGWGSYDSVWLCGPITDRVNGAQNRSSHHAQPYPLFRLDRSSDLLCQARHPPHPRMASFAAISTCLTSHQPHAIVRLVGCQSRLPNRSLTYERSTERGHQVLADWSGL